MNESYDEMIAKYNILIQIDIKKLMNFLTANPILSNFVKNFDEVTGFIWSENILMDNIINNINDDDHYSPSSLSLCLRECQRRLNN